MLRVRLLCFYDVCSVMRIRACVYVVIVGVGVSSVFCSLSL